MTTMNNIFTEQSDQAREERRAMADIDCDIEGMAKDARIAALCDQWRAEGVSNQEFTRRLAEAVKDIAPALAAE